MHIFLRILSVTALIGCTAFAFQSHATCVNIMKRVESIEGGIKGGKASEPRAPRYYQRYYLVRGVERKVAVLDLGELEAFRAQNGFYGIEGIMSSAESSQVRAPFLNSIGRAVDVGFRWAFFRVFGDRWIRKATIRVAHHGDLDASDVTSIYQTLQRQGVTNFADRDLSIGSFEISGEQFLEMVREAKSGRFIRVSVEEGINQSGLGAATNLFQGVYRMSLWGLGLSFFGSSFPFPDDGGIVHFQATLNTIYNGGVLAYLGMSIAGSLVNAGATDSWLSKLAFLLPSIGGTFSTAGNTALNRARIPNALSNIETVARRNPQVRDIAIVVEGGEQAQMMIDELNARYGNPEE